MKARISITALLVIVMASIAPATPAETGFPAKTIRIIAPVPPGSPPDVVARVIADQLSRDFGQPVIVENHPGANQTIGLGLVAAAPPDGHTLGMVSLPTAVVPNIVARMPFDTMRDLAPVREIAWTSNVLVVGSSSDIGSVRDLVAKAKAQPGRITFASGGNGTPAHVMAELFCDTAGIDMLHVPSEVRWKVLPPCRRPRRSDVRVCRSCRGSGSRREIEGARANHGYTAARFSGGANARRARIREHRGAGLARHRGSCWHTPSGA
jgi:tripartite-type tricarboxylate transporter receptor subunit TctC